MHHLGYTCAKFIDLKKFSDSVTYPEIIKVYNFRSKEKDFNICGIQSLGYLINPMLIGGLRPTLKQGYWDIIGKGNLGDEDLIPPDFMKSHYIDPELATKEFFIFEKSSLSQKRTATEEEVKFLQPFLAEGTRNIEIKLSMYFLLKEGKKIGDYFNLNDAHLKRLCDHVTASFMIE